MDNEEGTWIMHGLKRDDPNCIHSADDLHKMIDKYGFLPLFKNSIPGFSVEEYTVSEDWWSGDPVKDPWEWRKVIANTGKIAYGKFFDKKAGYISEKWIPTFANVRRNGYDFDAWWEDGKASLRQMKIMKLFDEKDEMMSADVKQQAGFVKGGEKNFEGVITSLQMNFYLCICDFQCKINRNMEPYGWPVSVYCKPEHLWGREWVTSAYGEKVSVSATKIANRLKEIFPSVTEKEIDRIING